MNRTPFHSIVLALAVLSACEDEDYAERFELRPLDANVEVLTLPCLPELCDYAVDIGITYPEQYLETEQAELLQYRIDYELSDVDGRVPYLAGPLEITLEPAGFYNVKLPLLGEPQRAFLATALEASPARGHARITLAGYAHDDSQLFLEIEIPIEVRAPSGQAQDGGL